MATHSNILPWRIPGKEELGELPSMGSHRVERDLAAAAAAAAVALGWSHKRCKIPLPRLKAGTSLLQSGCFLSCRTEEEAA